MKDSCMESDSRDQSSFLGLGAICCSICLDAVRDVGDRAIAKLKCGHFFHLDCIGSAFNVKGSMQCPNCRYVEEGQWRYANCSCRLEDSGMEGMESDAYEFFAGIIDILPYETVHPRRLMSSFLHSYQHLSVVLEGTNPSSSVYLLVHILRNRHDSLSSSMHMCPYLAAQRMAFDESGGVSYSRAESSSPSQARRHRGNSTRMQTVGSPESRTGSPHATGSSQFSRTVPNVENAGSAALPYERRRWSMPASGSRWSTPASGRRWSASGNHVAPAYGGSSLQFGHTGSRASRGSTSQPSRGTNMPYLQNVNNQGQRVNNLAQASSTPPLRQGSTDNGRRFRQREWPPEMVPDHIRSSNAPSRRMIREESVTASGASVGWQSNVQRYPWARDGHPGSRRSARDNERYLNLRQHISNAQSAEGMTSSGFLRRDFRGSDLSQQSRVEPESPFDGNLTQHTHLHPFQHIIPSNLGDGSVRFGIPFEEPQRVQLGLPFRGPPV